MRFLAILLFVFGFSLSASATIYKISTAELNHRFDCAVEISIFDSPVFDKTQQNLEARNINQNVAGVLSICCGSFGLHRFYMGHTEAGVKHLALGVSLAALFGASVIGLNYSSSSTTLGGTNVASTLPFISFALYGISYCGMITNGLYNLVEGVMYLTMSEEKFQGKIAKDPRFFAAFSRN